MRSNGSSESNLASSGCSNVWERVGEKQEEWLLPLKEDLASWINKTLGESHVTAENLMDVLDNGVTVCQLAKLIHVKAASKALTLIPPFTFKWWPNAQSFSFFARDNTANFLRWCRQCGINEAVLFESDSLVLHTQPRAVILCLLELSRMAVQVGIEPPGIIKLEKEIEETEIAENKAKKSQGVIPLSQKSFPQDKSCKTATFHSERDVTCDGSSTSSSLKSEEMPSKLHTKVLQIANAHCPRSYIRQITDGKYLIAGKIVFVRLLNDNHVMVRVGGGWDTLEHFVAHHSSSSEPSSSDDSQVETTEQEHDVRPRIRHLKPVKTTRRNSTGFIF